MSSYDLDLLRRQATESDQRGNPLPTDPKLILFLLDTIATLMDGDSLLAQGQRLAKDAIDKMVAARAQRDAARAETERLRAELDDLRFGVYDSGVLDGDGGRLKSLVSQAAERHGVGRELGDKSG